MPLLSRQNVCQEIWTSLSDSNAPVATWLSQFHDRVLQLAHEEVSALAYI